MIFPSLTRLAAANLFVATTSAAQLVARGMSKSCPVTSSTPLSCHNTTSQPDLCCFNAPGGQLLQTQFWDTDPATGPSNSFTIHGLWPDNCDGTYQSSCDPNRGYTNISSILQSFGANDLLNYMNTYWVNDPDDGSNESFWEHEWEKHGTCISSFSPSCYSNYQPTQEVVDFVNVTINLFKTLDSYKFLAAAGITPSTSQTYSQSDIIAALKAGHGQEPTIGCEDGALDQVSYYFNTQGSAQTGKFIAAAPDGSKSSCPSSGIKYLPKSGSSSGGSSGGSGGGSGSGSGSGSGGSGGSGTPLSGKGYINVVDNDGNQNGCLISNGKWLVGGTCATYTGSNGQLKTSKGACSVSNGQLTCASGNSAASFGADGNGNLEYQGSSSWSVQKTPSGQDQEAVTAGNGAVGISLIWQGLS